MSSHPHRVFLCHSSADKPAVRELYQKLRTARKLLFVIIILFTTTSCQEVQTNAPTSTSTVTPAKILAPRATLTPFLTPEILFYRTPEWLKKSNSQVLMFINDKLDQEAWSHHLVSFLNVDTGEIFDLKFPGFDSVHWVDKTRIMFLHGQGDLCPYFEYGSVLDLSIGKVERYKGKELYEKGFCPKTTPRFRAAIYDWKSKNQVYIFDELGRREEFAPNNNEITNLSVAISPDNSTVVILQDGDKGFDGYEFVIYDFQSRKVKSKFNETKVVQDFFFLPNSKQLAYLKDKTPCILDVDAVVRKCGVPIPEAYQDVYFAGVFDDKEIVIFATVMTDAKKICVEDLNGGNKRCELMDIRHDLCFYNVFTGSINCPTAKLDILKSTTGFIKRADGATSPILNLNHVVQYSISPDKKHILFVYGEGYPNGHSFNNLYRAVLDVDGGNYQYLGENFGGVNLVAEWRPAP